MAKNRMRFDVMLGDRYYGFINMDVSPIFPIYEEDITREVLNKYPTLRNKDFKVRPC